jgi:hypothetical protein
MDKPVAILAELKATFPNSTADWRELQIEAGASLSEAAIAYASHVEQKAAKEKADLTAQLEAAKKPAPGGSLGHRPLRQHEREETGDEPETGDAREDFEAAVCKIAGPRPDLNRRHAAIRSVAKRNPALYQAYLLATNQDGGATKKRLLAEKLDDLNNNPRTKQYAVSVS